MKKTYSVPLAALAVIVVLLIIVHLSLATWVRNLLNENMAEMGDYTGHVEEVDLFWWRGAYSIHNLNIQKNVGNVQAPFFTAPLIDIAVSWRALWEERALVAKVRFTDPELNFIDSENEQDRQTGEGVDWRERLTEQILIEVDELQVVNGTLAFRNFTSEPPVNVYANNLDMTVRNLSTARDLQGTRDASLEGTADFLNHAPLEIEAAFDPLLRMEDFELRFRVSEVDLTQLNDFASAYGNFDFNSGNGELVVEVDAEEGQLGGYIKPLLRDVDVFNVEQDLQNEDKGFFRGMWEALVGAGGAAVKNRNRDQIATRVDLSGSLQDADVSPLQAFFGILRNGFIEAFSAGFEKDAPETE
ncbi:DUF748 domain-containing protein [Halopseudomonas laoshanensis]|uniref:DUF748 domain-containing protein n=1 Tax=Halopseudomonas laoshanensis TaxID=2268758 RepID=A0A7V7GWF7_9GAMM|nr:DUF748 domain-containing protein [Halopseudomonas laoshanensis]KAA0696632.1 DUF748 domain-containing protein [Halopseudomonas laoshanensis]